MRYGIGDGGLLVPENVLDASGDYVSPEKAAQHAFEGRWLREELKSIDPTLDVVFVKPGSKVFPESPRWYIVRYRGTLPDQYFVIQDEHGHYCAPDWRHLQRFMEGDQAHNPRIIDDWKKTKDERKRRSRQRQQELIREFEEKLLERLGHEFDTKVGITERMKERLG